MKLRILSIFLISLLFSVNFGLMMMNHSLSHNDSSCPFTAIEAINCAQFRNPFSFALGHFKLVLGTFSAVFSPSLVDMLMLFILAIFSAWVFSFNNSKLLKLNPQYYGSKGRESFISSSKDELNYWLSLHENSPSLIR